MKVALITDQHWGIRNDNSRYIEYYKKFYENIFFPEIDRRQIKTIFNLGDIFDRRKFINYHSLTACREIYFDEILKRDIHQYAILGNHDTYFKNTNSINSPGLVLKDYENLTLVENSTYEVSFEDGTNILFVPWISSENYSKIMKEIQESKAEYCLGHFEFAGYLAQQNKIHEHGLDPKNFKKFKQVLSGHYHHRHYKDNIFYLGNPAQVYWNDYGDPRGFHIWDTDTNEFEFIQNPYTIFSKLYYNDEDKGLEELLNVDWEKHSGTYVKLIVDKKVNPFNFDQFVDKLLEQDVADLQIIDIEYLMSANELEEDEITETKDTLELIKNYIDAMDDMKYKKELKPLFERLYNEAQTIEL